MSSMELKYKKDNLKILYEMCLRELDLARKNTEVYTRKVKDAYMDVLSALENSYGTEDCFGSYDNTLTDLSQLSDALRKFNLKFELTPFFKNIILTDDLSASSEDIFEPAEFEKKVETFTYPQPLYDKYKPGYKADVVITYIKDSNELLFYINETGNSFGYGEFVRSLQNYFNESPQALKRIPQEGEVFGLHLEGYMFRAVRENGPLMGSEYKAYLIDCGEVITITKDMKLYILSFTHQKYCAQAIMCKLESVNSSAEINLKAYLEKHLYVSHKLTVQKRTNSVRLHVDLLTKENTNPFRNMNSPDSFSSQENHQDTLSKPITNPFRQFLCVTSEFGNLKENGQSTVTKQAIVKKRHNIINEGNHEATYSRDLGSLMHNGNYIDNNPNVKKTNKNQRHQNLRDFLDCTSDDEGSTTSSSRNSRSSRGSVKKAEVDNGRITEEERRILYEEPLNTTNAMKAVMGYNPKDDKIICPHTRPGQDSCFKGSRCRFEHVEKLKDGWTRDEAETIVDIPNKIVYPRNGQTIVLRPTHVVNVELFFAQIVSPESRYCPTLNELIFKMNGPEQTIKYKKFKCLPVRFQLVLAEYKDKRWYRAKVVNFIDDEMVKVFYVDYGNSDIITLDRIRQWEPQFDFLPFQAVSCRLAGVKEIRTKAVEASEFLRSKILDNNKNTVKALVINNTDQLLLRLFFGVTGEDVSEELISLGYAVAFSYDQADKGQLLPA